MNIGLNILDNLRISLGESIDDIVDSLTRNSIKYTIPFKSDNVDSGESNIIVYIESYGVELRLQNGVTTFIKTSNSKLNYIMRVLEESPASAVLEIRSKISSGFSVPIEQIRVDRFETTTFKSIMSIPYSEYWKAKITLIMGVDHGIYIETIQMVRQ